ncbi:MAG: Rhodanese domain protein cyanobacterial/alphaproteobacterial subgroup [Micavibrio sp.]|nr:Rhodanese domain protein cyanobacterial/alphaproteobacterial subgroup [Micavibrio sp.]
MTYKVAAFYRFVKLTDIPSLRAEVREFCLINHIVGTILLAPEGINGTIAGLPDDLDKAIDYLDSVLGLRQGELKFSSAAEQPFMRMKVRPKKEIITMRQPEADPTARTGIEVTPEQWNDLINDPEVLLIDTRNDYETSIGIFKGAVDPNIRHFSQFPDFVAKHLDPAKHKKVAMFCTGGIRCEKASSYMLNQGFETVYQLKGGILRYLENIPQDQSLWDGACFVFDGRLALEHGLEESEQSDAIRESREYRNL